MTRQRLLLEEMTWPEVERSIARGFTSVVVAAGAVELRAAVAPGCEVRAYTAEGVAAALRSAP